MIKIQVFANAAFVCLLAVSLTALGQEKKDSLEDTAAKPATEGDAFNSDDLKPEYLIKLLDTKEFDKIEKIAADLRKNRRRYGPGWWMIAGFDNSFHSSSNTTNLTTNEQLVKMCEIWKEQHPESVTASIALAGAHEAIGWKARGGGYADTVTEEGWRIFNKEEESAWKILKEAEDLEQKDPNLYHEMIYVATGLNKKRSEVEALLEKGVAIEPEYYPLYEQFSFYLTPRWHGRPGDIEKFARKSVEAGGPGRGPELYVRIALQNLGFVGDEEFIRDQNFSWEKLNEGFLAFKKLYPESRSIMNQYARLAAMYEQKEIAKPLFDQIHDEFYIGYVWPSEKYFKKYKAWVMGEGQFPKTNELCLAVKERDLDRARELLKAGVDANAEDVYGTTALLRAIGDKNEEMVQLLLNSGADVNTSTEDGRTATYYAAETSLPMLKIVLEKKPDVNKSKPDGWSPLTIAVHNHWADRVRLLCENGANVNAQLEGGYTPLWKAARTSAWDVAEVLLEFHADACIPAKDGWLPLHLAVSQKDADGVRRMLRKGADPNCKMENNGWTPLHYASNDGMTEVVKALLEFPNVDVNARSKVNDTPLHLAVWEGREEVVKLLVEKGADVTLKGTLGQTPIRYAKLTHRKEILEILEKAAKEKQPAPAK